MLRKHLFGICLFLFIAFGYTLFHLVNHPLAADKKLTADFNKHRNNFEKLVKIANEDANVMSVSKNYVLLNDYKRWQNDQQEDFSFKRWSEYKEIFKLLGSPYIHSISKDGDVIKISSASIGVSRIDDYESIVISKGYVYSLKEPSPLVDSLDGMGFETNGTFYKRIDENWYLYFDSGISKPE